MDDKKWYQQSDLALGLGALVIIGMLIIPLPGFLLDILILVSLAIGLLTVLISLSIDEPSDFSLFPSLLLITTLYRLALNVSTTRQILSKGSSVNSSIIDAFGSFVIGSESGLGKYVIGFIIFLILTLVQILVITKGATRISEVAARFTLDALPGKQMAIDVEVANGAIDEVEAQKRRKKIQSEVDFYGAMDGASKFVQGDVRASLIITFINLLGGIIIGSAIRGESIVEALETYGKLTIGDGLVSQIPALLSTTATGIIVTRSGSDSKLATQFKDQLFGNSKVLYMVSASLVLAAFIPGLPFIPLVLASAGLAYLAYILDKSVEEKMDQIEQTEQSQEEKSDKPQDYHQDLKTDPIEFELGLNLLPLVDKDKGKPLLEQISNLRKQFVVDYGIVVPPIRIFDNLELEPDHYCIKIYGVEVAQSSVKADSLMAVGEGIDLIEGIEFTEPSFGQKAKWISPDLKVDAESKSCTVVDSTTVIITYLKEVLSNYAATILGREEVKKLLDHYKKSYPTLIEELKLQEPSRLGLIQQVLQNLLREGIPIKNIISIFEAIIDSLDRKYDKPYLISEIVRQSLSSQISKDLLSEDKKLHVITFDNEIINHLYKSLQFDEIENREIIVLNSAYSIELLNLIKEHYNQSKSKGQFPIFVVGRVIRAALYHLVSRELPSRQFSIIAIEEISTAYEVIIESKVEMSESYAV